MKRLTLALASFVACACAAAPTPVGPCMTDVECRGDRICHDGRCRFAEEVRLELAERAQRLAAHGGQTDEPEAGPARADAGVDAAEPVVVPIVESPAFMGGPLHQGRSPRRGPRGTLRAEVLLRTGARIYAAPVQEASGAIVLGSTDRSFTRFALDGVVQYRYTGSERFYGTAVVRPDGVAVVGSHDGVVVALDALGSAVFRTSVAGPVDASLTLDTDGTVYVPAAGVAALGPDGAVRWHASVAGEVRSPPAIHPLGLIVFATVDGLLHALRRDGSLAWESRIGSGSDSAPTILDDGTIVIGTDAGTVVAVASDGRLLWQAQTGGDVRGTVAVGLDGTLVVGSDDRAIYGFAPDGATRFRVATGGRVRSSPRVDRDGYIYIGSQDDHLYVLAADGSLHAQLNLGSNVDATGAFVADGVFAIGCDAGTLMVVRGDS